MALRAPRQPGQPARPAARRQAGPDGDGGPQRRRVTAAAQAAPGRRPDHPQQGARRDRRGARHGVGAAAHRVLRRLADPGHRRGRLHGGLRGRPGPQERIPPVRGAGQPRRQRHRRPGGDERGDAPPVRALQGAGRGGRATRPAGVRHGGRARRGARRGGRRCRRRNRGRRGGHSRAARHRPVDRQAAPVRVPAAAGRRGRWPAAGQRRRGGAVRPRHHRRRIVWPGQASRGGLAARRGLPGDPAAHLRGALSAAAHPGRGAPVRDHLPPAAPLQADDRVRSGQRARAGGDPAQGAAAALRLAQAAGRGDPGGDHRGARHRPAYRGGGAGRAQSAGRPRRRACRPGPGRFRPAGPAGRRPARTGRVRGVPAPASVKTSAVAAAMAAEGRAAVERTDVADGDTDLGGGQAVRRSRAATSA